jgi:hypothetical protein
MNGIKNSEKQIVELEDSIKMLEAEKRFMQAKWEYELIARPYNFYKFTQEALKKEKELNNNHSEISKSIKIMKKHLREGVEVKGGK